MKKDLFNDDYMVIRMYNGKKIAQIHFNDDDNCYEIEGFTNEYYDYYEDEYNYYVREEY